jgi:hypothetical protein
VKLRKRVELPGGVGPEKLKHAHALWAAQSILLSAAHRPNRGGFVTTERANEMCNRKMKCLPAGFEGRSQLHLRMRHTTACWEISGLGGSEVIGGLTSEKEGGGDYKN